MNKPLAPTIARRRMARGARLLALLAAGPLTGVPAQTPAGGTATHRTAKEPGVVQKVGGAVERGAKAAASGVDRGVQAVAAGAKKAGEAVERGAKAAGSAVNSGAKKIGLPGEPASATSRRAP